MLGCQQLEKHVQPFGASSDGTGGSVPGCGAVRLIRLIREQPQVEYKLARNYFRGAYLAACLSCWVN